MTGSRPDEPGAAHTLPLFPLRTVLFPGGPLSLRIFEPRYVDMVGRCMRDGSPFGVLLIEEGGEVGPVGAMAQLGTCARIVDFSTLPDGLLGLTCLGGRRFQVSSRWTAPDGLHLAQVELLPEEASMPLPAEYGELQRALRSVFEQAPEQYAAVTPRWDDASWVSYRLAELVPLPPQVRLALLTLTDPLARLQRIAASLAVH